MPIFLPSPASLLKKQFFCSKEINTHIISLKWSTAEPFQTDPIIRAKCEAEFYPRYLKASERERDEYQLTRSSKACLTSPLAAPRASDVQGQKMTKGTLGSPAPLGWQLCSALSAHRQTHSAKSHSLGPQRACSEPHFKWPDASSQQEMAYFQTIPEL